MDPPRREPDDHSERADEAPAAPVPEPGASADAGPDLERIAGDLADVEVALDRLNDGTYWTDEITGETIPDDVLDEDPTARRVAYASTSRQKRDPTGARGEPAHPADSTAEHADETAPTPDGSAAIDPDEPPNER